MGEFLWAYDSVDEMMKFMPCELQRRVSRGSYGQDFTVFRSKNKAELSRLVPVSSITNTCRGTSPMEAIKFWLGFIHMENYLLQIWAPVTVGDKRYLTTSDQPFVMAELVKGLCSYRKQCLADLIPIDDVSTEEGHVGPPGRAFLNGQPEVCLDVRHYTTKEYPQRDSAVTYGIRCYFALPFRKLLEDEYDCVVELVANGFEPRMYNFANRMYPMSLKHVSPKFSEIKEMLLVVCKTHQLPLAQSWVTMPYSSLYKNEVRYDKQGSYIADIELRDFTEACSMCYIRKERGVVGKAISSKGACFCKDISQLSINEYSLVPNARKAGLTGCFAISLRGISTLPNYSYIVEFFLPSKETENGDPRTLIKMLLATMKRQLKSVEVGSAQELGEKLFVEVIKTSPTDEFDSFEICDLTGDDSTPNTMGYAYRGEMVQLDSTMSNAENAPGDESSEVHRMTPVPASSHLPVKTMQFASSSYHSHGFARKMRQEGTEAFPAAPSMMDPYAGKDKARSALHHEGAANVLLDANNLHQHGGEVVHFGSATSHAGNVNNVEQNIFSVEQYDINSIGEIVQLDDAINNTENMNTNVVEQNDSMEQHDTNSNISKNRRAIKRIEREYGITCADLLQHSGKKQEEAANHFGVSRSTFKRICRQHKIFRWRPCKLKQDDDLSNTTQDLIQTSEKIMEDSHVKDLPLPIKPVEQDLNSKPNSTQNAMTVQNGGSIIVKVTYRDDMINFHLSVSSGKMALEEEIAKRFCLSIGSFSIKYLDEDEDEILVTCDADLKTSISIMRSLGKNTVKMLVKLSQDN